MKESTLHVSEDQLFNALKAGEEWAWKMAYSLYKSSVTRFVVYHHGNKQDGEAIFRESLMVFYEKINRPSFIFNAKIRTFLMAIAHNLWSKKLEESGQHMVAPRLFEQQLDFYQKENFEFRSGSRVGQLVAAIEKLGSRERDLLVAWYFHQISPEVISRQLGLESEELVLEHKNQCIHQLKTLLDCKY